WAPCPCCTATLRPSRLAWPLAYSSPKDIRFRASERTGIPCEPAARSKGERSPLLPAAGSPVLQPSYLLPARFAASRRRTGPACLLTQMLVEPGDVALHHVEQ